MRTLQKNIQSLLKSHSLDALLISNPTNIAYITGITHFSVQERDAFVLATAQQNFLFTDSRFTGGLNREDHNVEIIECGARSTFYEQFDNIVRHNKWRRIGYDPIDLSVYEFKRLQDISKSNKTEQSNSQKKLSFISLYPALEILRIQKTSDEIASVKKACEITDQAFSVLLKHVSKGVSEKHLAYILEDSIRKNGGEIAFPTIVAFGPNSAVPHHHTGVTQLGKSGTPILLDFGARVNGYNADMTRTIFFGKPSPSLEQQYKATHFIQTKALHTLEEHVKKHGFVSASTVDNSAQEALQKTAYLPIPHALGHGVGLDVHEAPTISSKSKDILKPGMIVTIEPGIYITGTAGVRIEDTVLLTDSGIEILTQSSKSIIIL